MKTTLIAALLALTATAVEAAPTTFTTDFGDGRVASVSFEDLGGGILEVTLSNLGDDVMVPTDVLTGVFFTLSGDPTLTPVSASLNGSTVYFAVLDGDDVAPVGGDLGGEWAYRDGISGLNPYGSDEGISSTGLGVFGTSGRFGSTNLQGPDAVDGLQYGITSVNDDLTTGNAAVTGQFALVKSSVVFTLSGLPTDWVLGVSDIAFQYGTSFDEGGNNVPEPFGIVLAGVAGVAFLGLRRRR